MDQRTKELRETVAELERSYEVTLEALGDALDLKDAETEGHSKRVTAYTIQIARAMGLICRRYPHAGPRRLSARYWKDGDSRCNPAQTESSQRRKKSPL